MRQAPTILVVDDDLGIQQTIGSILEDEGYRVLSAFNGREALTQLDSGAVEPALILLDMGMPEMDGYTFAAELARRNRCARTPIVVVTADGQAAHKAAQVGADGYLAKPFTLPTLLAAVERFVRPDA